jgi:hypothetical protein
MRVTYIKTSTKEEIKPATVSEDFAVISNEYNSFVAEQMNQPGVVAHDAYQAEDNGLVRAFSNDVQIILYPKD